MNQQLAQKETTTTDYWDWFRKNIIGNNLTFRNEYGTHKALYADRIASGGSYKPIEDALTEKTGRVASNPHSNGFDPVRESGYKKENLLNAIFTFDDE